MERLALRVSKGSLRSALFGSQRESPEVFQGLDADGDRRLTFNEFRQGLSSLGMSSAGLQMSSLCCDLTAVTKVVNPRSLFDSLDRPGVTHLCLCHLELQESWRARSV